MDKLLVNENNYTFFAFHKVDFLERFLLEIATDILSTSFIVLTNTCRKSADCGRDF